MLYLNLLIRLSLFGGEGFNRLLEYEVVKRTKKVTMAHIASNQRIYDLFNLTELSAVKFIQGDKTYTSLVVRLL